MNSAILQLCILSMICGAALSIIPDGGPRRVTELLCTAVLTAAVLSPLKELDLDSYALESAKLKAVEDELLSSAAEAEDKLNRLCIQQEYNEYIMDRAAQLGIEEIEVSVLVQWNLEGVWVPDLVQITAECEKSRKEKLCALITSELGIPPERQYWYSERES